MSGYAFHPDAFADLDEIWEYRIDHHPAKDHSSLEKHTGDIRVRNLIKLLRLPV